jgi:hypothetical protein
MWARRCLLLAFFAYVVLDLSCPFVPGAFTFDPADSVDAVSAYRARPASLPRVASVPSTTVALPFVPGTERAVVGAVSALSPVGWRPHAVRERAGTADHVTAADDD